MAAPIPSPSSLDRGRRVTMNWRVCVSGMLGVLGGVFLVGSVQAGVIPPTVPATRLLSTDTSVTVSLYQLDSTLPQAVTRQSPSRCTSTGTPYYKDVTD